MRRRKKVRRMLAAALASFVAIGWIGEMATLVAAPMLLPPFGASCVILFVIPDSAFARPRNLIGGYLLAGSVGLLATVLLGTTNWACALGVAAAILFMQLTETLHPPAAALPLLMILQGEVSWQYLVYPVLSGSVSLAVVAAIFNRLSERKHTQATKSNPSAVNEERKAG